MHYPPLPLLENLDSDVRTLRPLTLCGGLLYQECN